MTDDKPATATDQHLLFLDALRQSGATNVDGAELYLLEAFPDLSQTEAQAVVEHWIRTFAERHPEGADGGGT
jgi:hypothetical protein